MLTKEEKEEISKLKYGFNVYKTEVNYDFDVSRKFELARPMSKKLLTWSSYLNILTLIIFAAALIITIFKPSPTYYASTPNGKIYKLETIKLPKKGH